jgi:hypothetical protein
MKRWITLTFILCSFGCTHEHVDPIDRTVHLAGVLRNSCDGGIASYWKDGAYTPLVSSTSCSVVSSLSVDGSTVLVAGSKYQIGSPGQSVVWRNGTETVMDEVFGAPFIASRDNNLFGVWLDLGLFGWVFHKNGTSQLIADTAYSYGVGAMAIDGDDIYTAGYSSGRQTPPTYSSRGHAQYWKNGQLLFRESAVSNGSSIFVHEGDVYMGGDIDMPGDSNHTVCYWKNAQRVDLTDGHEVAMARSIFATDNHVYVAGMIDGNAVYWKDGEVIHLTTAGNYSIANSIFVQGDDVHLGGTESGHPAYWKNGVKQTIQNEDQLGEIKFLVVGSH